MNIMTTNQAYSLVEQATGQLQLTRIEHQRVSQALAIIQKAIQLNEEDKKTRDKADKVK